MFFHAKNYIMAVSEFVFLRRLRKAVCAKYNCAAAAEEINRAGPQAEQFLSIPDADYF